jgi:hypothetical protein
VWDGQVVGELEECVVNGGWDGWWLVYIPSQSSLVLDALT